MNWKYEWKTLSIIAVVFLGFYFLPVTADRVTNAVSEALTLTQWYAREHVLFCLIPAFFIAGAISVFLSQNAIMKYLGPQANKFLAYGVASVSGCILAVCSCTVLPLFAGIYKRGAGLGPATAFLYSGPAINILAIILTARILGAQLGIARAIGAIVFAIVIGLLMHLIYRREEQDKADKAMLLPEVEEGRPLWQTATYFIVMVALLVFATWGNPGTEEGFYYSIFSIKWPLTSLMAVLLGIMLTSWFKMPWWKIGVAGLVTAGFSLGFSSHPEIGFSAGIIMLSIFLNTTPGESQDWFAQSWGLAKQILPLLFYGVLVAGALLGRPESEGLIPSEWVATAVGGNSIWSNFFASIAGAFMYFATLTEVPILQGLISNGMGQGPALALLLAGPALSLPNMLVIASIMGWKKTTVFVSLVVIMATITGIIYGSFIGGSS